MKGLFPEMLAVHNYFSGFRIEHVAALGIPTPPRKSIRRGLPPFCPVAHDTSFFAKATISNTILASPHISAVSIAREPSFHDNLGFGKNIPTYAAWHCCSIRLVWFAYIRPDIVQVRRPKVTRYTVFFPELLLQERLVFQDIPPKISLMTGSAGWCKIVNLAVILMFQVLQILDDRLLK